jgi:F-type H+-transporting ATPase subunit delta
MAFSPAAARAEAKRLLALSLEKGEVSAERVGAILAALAKHHASHQLRPILKAYLASVRREVARSEARVEHAGPLSAESLKAIGLALSRTAGRSLRTTAQRNDRLLAGLRVRVGDDVLDLTALGRLERLERSLAA